MTDELRVAIESDADVVSARREARALAAELNFTSTDVTLLATAISEIARNITTYAGEGVIMLSVVHRDDRAGIRVEARDEGPGIRDVERAMEDGYSTGTGMGLGLPGARRLTDEFSIDSRPGRGTTIVMVKWGRAT